LVFAIKGGFMLIKEYQRYDTRLENLVAKSEDISRFVALGIPRSTLRQWQLGGPLGLTAV